MGWKTFKEKFKIDHIVQITGDKLCIGSPYINDLSSIEISSGKIIPKNDTFSNFLSESYPEIESATDKERLSAINAKDVFDKKITVYTYDNNKIVKKYAEALGYPNITHDGELMHDNTFFLKREESVEHALDEINCELKWIDRETKTSRENIARLEKKKIDLTETIKTILRKE